MTISTYRLSYDDCQELLRTRLEDLAPGRIQLLSGPRQVGKTTLLLELARRYGAQAIYVAADGPEAALPGFWERLWARVEETTAREGRAFVFLDEAHLIHDWAARLKGEWDRIRRLAHPVHVVASGSSALRLGVGSRESLAGRFERITLTHWSASSLGEAFGVGPDQACESLITTGSYPGAFGLRDDPRRWTAYVRDSIVEPAIGRDIVAMGTVRKPALLRQVFAVCVSSPAQIVSLQKIRGQLEDAGALETIAHYLTLLEDAFLIAAAPKFSETPSRQRAAPPKLIPLNNALIAAIDPRGIPDRSLDPKRFGACVENACLAHAWNSGQKLSYWRQEPYEVDAVIEGDWGAWAIEVKTGAITPADLKGLAEFTKRHARFRPLVLCDEAARTSAERAGFPAIRWQDFLLRGVGQR